MLRVSLISKQRDLYQFRHITIYYCVNIWRLIQLAAGIITHGKQMSNGRSVTQSIRVTNQCIWPKYQWQCSMGIFLHHICCLGSDRCRIIHTLLELNAYISCQPSRYSCFSSCSTSEWVNEEQLQTDLWEAQRKHKQMSGGRSCMVSAEIRDQVKSKI